MSHFRGRGAPTARGRAPVRPGRDNANLRSQVLSHKTNSVRRLQKDLKELRDAEVPLVGVSATPLDDSIFTWHANIRAPADSVYAGAVFHIEMTFPQDYPCSPPSLTIFNCQIIHPNVFGSKLCLDMLENNSKGRWYEGWNSAYTVESIMIQLQSFLFDKPKGKKKRGEDEEEWEDKFKEIVNLANSYKCNKCKHRGPIEPYPPFHAKEADISAFCIVRDPKQMISDELLCFHTRTPISESTLGIGVSLSRLPRTGEIRSVTPSLDMLCLRAFQKQNVRKSIDGVKFTHWLPLFFGESKPYEKKSQTFNNETQQFDNVVTKINPRERMIHLLKKSICFLTKKDTRKEMTADMVIEVMPKLLTTHLVDMVGDNTHVSLVAIRRLFNFIRLFRLLIELQPEADKILDQKLKTFKEEPEKRVKDHCNALGDILSFATVSNNVKLNDVLDAYLEE
jgi:ubiquitin-protein ligase